MAEKVNKVKTVEAKGAATDMVVKYKDKAWHVPEGMTVNEFADSLKHTNPKFANSTLIDEGAGVFTIKPLTSEKG